jgi:hypothetical protein
LEPIQKHGDNPWDPWYDKAFAFVVRAATEEKAREIANSEAGDENRGEFLGGKIANTKGPWLDAKYSTCKILTAKGDEGMIMRDFAAA